MDKLSQIIQNYIGSYPADKSCSTWNEMQSKMEEEINAFFATPSTVESPFSKDELEVIIGAMEIGHSANRITREVIHAKANHLLTNANEFPCLMEVKTSIDTWIKTMVYGIYDGQFMTRIQGDDEYYGYKHARPIEQKPKELKDAQPGDEVWAKKTQRMVNGKNGGKKCFSKFKKYTLHEVDHKNDFYSIIDDRQECHGLDMDYLSNVFQLTPPTEQQFTAAEEAAINEVKERFEKARKEVQGE